MDDGQMSQREPLNTIAPVAGHDAAIAEARSTAQQGFALIARITDLVQGAHVMTGSLRMYQSKWKSGLKITRGEWVGVS
jgi:hypothetical protein